MARSIKDIHQGMIDDIAANATLSSIMNSTSLTAIYRLFTYIIAVAIHLHEVIFDEHKEEVQSMLDAQKTHNRQWYADMAKKFQYGYDLSPDVDYYDVIDDSAQIVAQSAVDEINGTLFMKVAKEESNELSPLSTSGPDEITPFTEYIRLIKDAGVVINIVSADGDLLRLTYKIWYNPLVLNSEGKLLSDTGTEPAKDTIKNFIRNLSFNGEFIPVELTDALQATEGIDIPQLMSIETKFAANDWNVVDGKVTPYAGYLTITDENLTLNYVANVQY